MKITIEIDTENSAFEDDFDGEIKRIAIEGIKGMMFEDNQRNQQFSYGRDLNGNSVASFEVTE